jgi:hypothetical protein
VVMSCLLGCQCIISLKKLFSSVHLGYFFEKNSRNILLVMIIYKNNNCPKNKIK